MHTARIVQPEAAGSAITLETSEPLFYLAVALNACGYDAGLADSNPVRTEVREEINQELVNSAPGRDTRDALCAYIREHALNDPSRSLAQYVSLSLYLQPPPALTPAVDETELPPDAAQVIGVLPLVRDFAEAVRLNALWVDDQMAQARGGQHGPAFDQHHVQAHPQRRHSPGPRHRIGRRRRRDHQARGGQNAAAMRQLHGIVDLARERRNRRP